MANNIFERLKTIELARFFIANYHYRDMEIKNVDGIFLENRSSQYQIIRISNTVNNDVDAFDKEIELLNKVVAQFKNISNIEDVKMINIYFDGYVQEEVGVINSLVIRNNNDIKNNILLTSEFPSIINSYNLDQVNQVVDASSGVNRKNIFNPNTTNNDNNLPRSNTNTNERKITDMFSIQEINKKIKFTKYFTLAMVALSLFFTIYIGNMQELIYEFSFYDKFAIAFQQYYRLFTGLFISDSILFTVIFAYFFYRYNTFVELKLGTKKTIILYSLGILTLLVSMVFVLQSQPIFGTLPILSLMFGAYFAIILLPSQKDFRKIHLKSSISVIVIYVLLAISSKTTSIELNIIALITSFVLVFILKAKDEAFKVQKLAIFTTALVAVSVGLFMFNGTLTRSLDFEEKYYEFIGETNELQAKKYNSIMNDYYKNIGAIEYDE
ncbi:MAG: rhomboid family intramembrane serine protease [Erysipelotrichales bacterium]